MLHLGRGVHAGALAVEVREHRNHRTGPPIVVLLVAVHQLNVVVINTRQQVSLLFVSSAFLSLQLGLPSRQLFTLVFPF